MLKKLLVISSTIALASCATIFSPSSDQVTFNSTPPGAKVYINGGYVGKTSLTTPIKRSTSTPAISIKKDGYETTAVPLQTEFNSTSWFNVLFPIGFVVDAATGNLMKASQYSYDVELSKK